MGQLNGAGGWRMPVRIDAAMPGSVNPDEFLIFPCLALA